MPTAVLAGAFGQRNPGDDALLEAFVEALPAGWDAVATSPRPVGLGDDVPSVPSGDMARVARSVVNADAVVFAGGTIFKELSPRAGRPPLDLLQKGLAMAYGAKALGKPLAMVGVGAAPIRSRRGRLIAARLVKQADLLVLRDEESADVLAEAGAPAPFRIASDAVWSILDEPPVRREPDDRVIVAVSQDAGEDLAGRLAASLVPVLAAGLPVALQPWQVGGPVKTDDLDLARAVQAQLGGAAEILVPPASVAEARELFSRTRLVVGMRFHALVAAAAAGAPFVAWAHEPKLAAVARRMHQPAVTPDMAPEAIGSTILAAARGGQSPLPAAVRAEIAASESAMSLLRLLLTGGEAAEADVIGALPLRPAAWQS